MSDQPIIVYHRPSVKKVDGNLDRIDNNDLRSDDVKSNKIRVFEQKYQYLDRLGQDLRERMPTIL